jgi:DnaJ family protein C protein 7
MEELKQKTPALAKEIGNNSLKVNKLDAALEHYSAACDLDDKNAIYFSNRSACYQAKRQWKEALFDGKKVIELDNQFGKGYLHVCRSLIQLKNFPEATEFCNKAKSTLKPENLTQIEKSLAEITTDIANMGIRKPIYDDSMNATKRAEKFKEDGNKFYKLGEYQDAIRLFSQAIAANPKEGTYLGNRAACWMMLAQYKRCIEDCDEGLKLEESPGSFDKIRVRKINAIIACGKLDDAKKYIQEILASRPDDAPKVNGPDSWESLSEKVEKLKALYEQSNKALENREFSRSKRLVQTILSSGVIDDPFLNLLSAKVHLELGEHREASEKAQKVIGGPDSSGFIEAYLVRADALMGLGLQDQASKHLSAALQLDPDNQSIVKKLKNVRLIISETTRIRAAVDDAINKKQYDDALKFCQEGLQLDKSNKKLMAEFSLKRSRLFHTQAKQLHRLVVADEDKIEEKKGKTDATWKKCLQDANTCLYYDATLVAALLLKADALIALLRFEEAVSELESVISANRDDDMDDAKSKLKEAKFALKKSKRVCLYALLGVANKELATEKEIKVAYKKSALKFHPDRLSGASEEKKKEAEEKFKQIGDAFELLSDVQRKRLYDQGYDRDEIEQMIEQENQRAQYNQHYGGHRRYY